MKIQLDTYGVNSSYSFLEQVMRVKHIILMYTIYFRFDHFYSKILVILICMLDTKY